MVDRDERFYIATTRFTNYTYKENLEWRERFKWTGNGLVVSMDAIKKCH